MSCGEARVGRRLAASGMVLILLTLSACGATLTRNPVPSAQVEAAQPFGIAGLREWGDETSAEALQRLLAARAPLLQERFAADIAAGRPPTLHYLALSGGGQWGAFGAGVLDAWSESGERPEFFGVSGVSTGAIIAPFAFLGSGYDDVLREIYSRYATADLVEPTLFSGLLSGAALADTRLLADVIASYVTPDLLEAIAAEHRKGRLLYIGTTNLDASRPVIWDIGAIAASGEPGALELVRDLIRASAAIPVAFPPIFVEVETPDGEVYDEMHVDGGASSQVTFVSPQIPIRTMTVDALGRNLDRRLWVIVNNDLEPPHQAVRPRIASIGSTAVSSLIRGGAVGDVYRLWAIAERDDIDFNVTWLPGENPCPAPQEDFDIAFMTCLFDHAGDLYRRGDLWSDLPPFWVEEPETPGGAS